MQGICRRYSRSPNRRYLGIRCLGRRRQGRSLEGREISTREAGIGSGLGYTQVLLAIAAIRELFGFGSLFGIQILGDWWIRWSIMVMAPSAFFILALFIWIINNRYYKVKA